jgi:hypothetical protein
MMTSYTAPQRDMLFVLNHLAGLEAVSQLPGLEDATPDMAAAILDEAAKFAAGVLAPINASGDLQGCRWDNGVVTPADGFADAYASFCETGWNAMPAQPEFGGQGLPSIGTNPTRPTFPKSGILREPTAVPSPCLPTGTTKKSS